MIKANIYGIDWEIDEDPKKGQLGLLREDHYRPLFDPKNRGTSLCLEDRWLDIGANIGAFAVRAAPYVDKIIAAEPEPENLFSLQRNINLNNARNIITLAAAIVGGTESTVPLALSNSFSSTHRLGKIRGRKTMEVPALNINETIHLWGINKIKMDCEGTEAEILEAIDFSPIEELIFEYHFSFLHDESWERFYRILGFITDAGFILLKQPSGRSKTWHTIVWAKRL